MISDRDGVEASAVDADSYLASLLADDDQRKAHFDWLGTMMPALSRSLIFFSTLARKWYGIRRMASLTVVSLARMMSCSTM